EKTYKNMSQEIRGTTPYLSLKEAAELAGKSDRTMRRMFARWEESDPEMIREALHEAGHLERQVDYDFFMRQVPVQVDEQGRKQARDTSAKMETLNEVRRELMRYKNQYRNLASEYEQAERKWHRLKDVYLEYQQELLSLVKETRKVGERENELRWRQGLLVGAVAVGLIWFTLYLVRRNSAG
ncbi:MAG: hypothetical protein D6722_18610, partial [Bacteroidetes bacterium]